MLIQSGDSLEESFSKTVHEINRGALDKRHPFRYVVLTTHSSESINSRYVVLREVDNDLNLYMHSDSRTSKIEDLEANNSFAIVMYHKSKKAQIRINGKATIHTGDDLMKEQWKNVKGNGKKAYGPIIEPGKEIDSPEEAHHWPEDIDETYFSVVKAEAHFIEVLQLNKMEHFRAEFKKDNNGNWDKKWIAP